MSMNYARLTVRTPGQRTPHLVETITFDDAFERQAADAIGKLIAMAGPYMPHARIVVHSKEHLRKDLARYVVEVGL